MFAKRLLAVLVPATLVLPLATSAHAGVSLIGIGQISGSDLSGLNGTLENGAPANTLGGLGSAIAWAGGDTFLLTPDRGPNASAWNSSVDNTTSWIPRRSDRIGISAVFGWSWASSGRSSGRPAPTTTASMPAASTPKPRFPPRSSPD